jgi:hypothetical protein
MKVFRKLWNKVVKRKTSNVFNDKGSAAEQLISEMCGNTYFSEFCFKNPYIGEGKNRKELCDVLIILGDVAVIWQIKNVKLAKDGNFKDSDVNYAIRQTRGARRKLLLQDKITLRNIDGKEKSFVGKDIKEVHLIAAIEGGHPKDGAIYSNGDNQPFVHLFYQDFTRYVTRNLNTVKDLIRYLAAKEALLNNVELWIKGGEEELLAYYINHAKKFDELTANGAARVYLNTDGEAKKLEKKDKGYKEKLEADKTSKAWDELINKKREATSLPGSNEDVAKTDEFLAIMMKHDRFERRILGQTYLEAAGQAASHKGVKSGFVYRRYFPSDDVTYVFAFMGKLNENHRARQSMLELACLAARLKFPKNQKIIGVVTEKNMILNKEGNSFDWVMLDIPDEDIDKAIPQKTRDLMVRFKILTNPEMKGFKAYEFPEDYRKENT